MKRFFILILILSALSIGASAQATIEAGVGLHFNNLPGQNDVFGTLTGEYKVVDKFTLNASVYGDFSRTNPKVTARATYGASVKFAQAAGWNLSVGAGGFKVGNEVGTYGGLGASYKGLEMSGVYGQQNFTEAQVFYPLYKNDHVEFGPFFIFTNMDQIQPIDRGGLKIRFKQ